MSSSKGNSKYSSKKNKNPTKARTSLVLTLRGNFLAIHFHPVLFFSLACFYRHTSNASLFLKQIMVHILFLLQIFVSKFLTLFH